MQKKIIMWQYFQMPNSFKEVFIVLWFYIFLMNVMIDLQSTQYNEIYAFQMKCVNREFANS